MKYEFLVESYETERVKVLSVWSEFRDGDLPVRPRPDDPRGRSLHEHMVHQCVSEDAWFRTMLGIDVGTSPLPEQERRLEFIKRYAEDSARRLAILRETPFHTALTISTARSRKSGSTTWRDRGRRRR